MRKFARIMQVLVGLNTVAQPVLYNFNVVNDSTAGLGLALGAAVAMFLPPVQQKMPPIQPAVPPAIQPPVNPVKE